MRGTQNKSGVIGLARWLLPFAKKKVTAIKLSILNNQVGAVSPRKIINVGGEQSIRGFTL